jgi:hypothetical protein
VILLYPTQRVHLSWNGSKRSIHPTQWRLPGLTIKKGKKLWSMEQTVFIKIKRKAEDKFVADLSTNINKVRSANFLLLRITTVMTIDGSSLHYDVHNKQGEEIDYFTINKE